MATQEAMEYFLSVWECIPMLCKHALKANTFCGMENLLYLMLTGTFAEESSSRGRHRRSKHDKLDTSKVRNWIEPAPFKWSSFGKDSKHAHLHFVGNNTDEGDETDDYFASAEVVSDRAGDDDAPASARPRAWEPVQEAGKVFQHKHPKRMARARRRKQHQANREGSLERKHAQKKVVTQPKCAAAGAQCAGKGDSLMELTPCCDAGYNCSATNEWWSSCKKKKGHHGKIAETPTHPNKADERGRGRWPLRW